MSDPDTLLSVAKVARRIHRDWSWVKRALMSGEIPGGVHCGGRWSITERKLAAWLDGHPARPDPNVANTPSADVSDLLPRERVFGG